MTRDEAIHCKGLIDDFILSFFDNRETRPHAKIIMLHPTDDREDMWVVVLGIPLDAPFYHFDEDVNVGVMMETKRDDVKLIDDVRDD